MEEERLTNKEYESRVEGGRGRGRRLLSWLDWVGKACSARSIELQVAKFKCFIKE